MNIYDSKVSFVNIIRAHGLETKETWTGPYSSRCYYHVRYVLLLLVYIRCSVGFTDKIWHHTQLAKMSFDKIFDLTAGVYFNFYNIRIYNTLFGSLNLN